MYARIREPLGASYVSRFTVNPWGSPAVTTNALSEVTTIVYNNAGLPWTIQKPGFGTALDTLLYNGSGLVTYARAAGDSSTSITYGAWAQPTKDSTPGRPVVTYTLGANGTVTNIRWGGVTRESYLYDSYGRLTRVTDALNTVVRRLGYPTSGTLRNLTNDTLPGNRVTVYGYDTYGRPTTVTPPWGPQQVTHYNSVNLVDSVRVLTSPTTRVKYLFDRLGRDTVVTDAVNQAYRYTYNALGWLIKQTDPVGARDTFQYNVGGELKRSTNRRNQNIDFSYDVLHRLTSRAGSVTSTWTYTTNSLVVTATQPNVATVTTYPSRLGPPDSVKTVINGKTYWQRYLYTSAGLDSVHFTGSQDASHFMGRRYFYDASSGALSVIRLKGSATTLTRDATLAVTAVDLPGSGSVTRTMGSLHAPLTSTTEPANNTALESWLGFNTLGQIDRFLKYTGRIGRWFAYDSLGQLRMGRTRHQDPDATLPPNCPNFDYGMSGNCTPNGDYSTTDSIAYTYDAAGNRTSQSGNYTNGNRITAFDGCTYQTDAIGNVVSRRGSTPCVQIDTLLWTVEGWLDSLKVGITGIKFLYDASGRLTVKRVNGAVVSRFLWDGATLLAEITALDSVVTEYSYYGMDSPHAVIKQPAGKRLYARIDGLVNVAALTDSTTSLRTTYGYDDWGKLTSWSDVEGFNGTDRARWKGALWLGPELDIYYMRARWYEPQTGRFLSEDPIGLAGGMNPFVFAGNDPVNARDPTGLAFWCYGWSVNTWPVSTGVTCVWYASSSDNSDEWPEAFWDYHNPAADARWRSGPGRRGGPNPRPPGQQDELSTIEKVIAALTPDFLVPIGQCIEKSGATGLAETSVGIGGLGVLGSASATQGSARLLGASEAITHEVLMSRSPLSFIEVDQMRRAVSLTRGASALASGGKFFGGFGVGTLAFSGGYGIGATVACVFNSNYYDQ